ncbi:MAG: TRAP transporter large permease [Desulfobacteraceae bacterium]|nr:MAG: TRAP transporter large permease [Desulfobacteraceae bacterium]
MIETGILGIGILLVLMAAGMHIGFAMMLIGFLGYAHLVNFTGALHMLGVIPYQIITSYDFCVIPLFFLMAAVCVAAGLGRTLFKLIYTLTGRIPGGLALATIGACAFFAAASSSTIATAATIGRVAIPEMKTYKYDMRVACGCVAAGGTLGILIPPSGILIIYGIITEQSISKLFTAGIIPGIMLTILFMTATLCWALINPIALPSAGRYSLKEKLIALASSFEMVLLLLLIILGILFGWFTPTEAGGAGAFGAIVLSIIKGRLTFKGFKEAFTDTLLGSGMVFTIVIGALVFNGFLAVSTIPMELAGWVKGFDLPPILTVVIIIVVYIILGCFLDSLSIVILTVPIFAPLIAELGLSLIWFGITIVLVTEMALITPPVGMNVFVIFGISGGVPIEKIFRGTLPFLGTMVILLIMLIMFPEIALFLTE